MSIVTRPRWALVAALGAAAATCLPAAAGSPGASSANQPPQVRSLRFVVPPAVGEDPTLRIAARDPDQNVVAFDLSTSDGFSRHVDKPGCPTAGNDGRNSSAWQVVRLKLGHRFAARGDYDVSVSAISSDCGQHPHLPPQFGPVKTQTLRVFPRRVRVPKLVGSYDARPHCVLVERGLGWRTDGTRARYHDRYCNDSNVPGAVMSPVVFQRPRAGERVAPGTVVFYSRCGRPGTPCD